MNSFLLLNIGNTHTQWVAADESGKITGEVKTLLTADWMRSPGLLPAMDDVEAVWASCVVPEARSLLAGSGIYSALHFVDAASAGKTGLDFSLVDTSTLGADRIANAAALLDYPLPAICIDCGTAVTLEVVTGDKCFAGGAILPGRKLMRRSLAAGTAALPELPLSENVPMDLGRNTREALALGIDRGIVGMVREMLEIAREYSPAAIVAAGGDVEFFCHALPELIPGGADFTLRGVGLIAAKHAKKA